MSDVPSSDWGNDLSLMSANVPEHSLSYHQRIPRPYPAPIAHTSHTHPAHIAHASRAHRTRIPRPSHTHPAPLFMAY